MRKCHERKKQSKVRGIRKGGCNGKTRRTAAQLERQDRVFRMNVIEGWTQREMRKELHISSATA